ncbi:hypothetical protein BVI1335_770008 [Burkholderia vietnamiensis]|nr:hypothetical protein BVI1335_770008 [Burkholderia vietnamiensis]
MPFRQSGIGKTLCGHSSNGAFQTNFCEAYELSGGRRMTGEYGYRGAASRARRPRLINRTDRPPHGDSTGAACVSRWPRGRGTRCAAGRARASSVPMQP